MTQITPQAVLDQRPKFYGRSRRFKTYGYGGRSLRPFLRPKVLLVVFLVFSKMEAEMSNFTMGTISVIHHSTCAFGTCACAKPVPEIVPMVKLYSLIVTLIKKK